MNQIQESVKNFYNAQAEKFSWTRKKQWPEFFYIKQEVEKLLKKKGKIKIIELGCWDGRLFRFLEEYFPGRIEYTGVDISEWLISIAKDNLKMNNIITDDKSAKQTIAFSNDIVCDWKQDCLWCISPSFIVSDMLTFLEKQDQQSCDMVVAVASFQHISTRYERLLILKNIYRVLDYDGICQMFNWSFSHWFFKKYTKQIAKAFIFWILSLFTKPLNDIYIPWKNDWKVYYRYYHIFFMYELRNLFKQAWFVIKELCYINKQGNKSVSWKDSRNTMIIARKGVLYDHG